VGSRVVSKVDTLALSMEEVLEVSLPISLLNRLDACNALSLSVELVTVVANLIREHADTFFAQIFVFSFHLDKHCLDHSLKVFILHSLGLLAHGVKMHVETVSDVRAALLRRLNAEADTVHIAEISVSRKNNVAQLLDSSQLVEGGLIKELDGHVSHQRSL
jgi:hypothetical protein